jgi:hypothetical protein
MSAMKRPEEVSKTSRPMKTTLLGLAALLLAGGFAARHVSDWPIKLRYPGEQGVVEGTPLAEIVHLRQGVPIYAPPSAQRFAAVNYGPLYFLLGSRLVRPDAPTYFPLRVLSLLATLGCAAGCAMLAFWLTLDHFAAALAPLVFLSYGFVTTYGLSARADLMALLLFFGGFLIAYRFREGRALLAAAPFMVLGVYYKQQFVAGPLAVFLFLILEKRYRLAAVFASLMALGGLGLLAVFEWLVFPGQAFFRHFVVYNMLPFSWPRFCIGAGYWGLMFLVPLLLGLEFLRVQRDKLLACYLGCAAMLSLATVGRQGSDSNYFLECAVVLSVLVAALVARNLSAQRPVSEILILLAVMLFLAQPLSCRTPRAEDFASDRQVQELLRKNFPPHTLVLASYPGDFLRAGLDTPTTDLFMYSYLVLQGKLPEGNLLMQLRERSFALVAIHYDLRDEQNARHRIDPLPDSWRGAILQNYQLITTIDIPAPERFLGEDRFYIWIPRTNTTPDPAPTR